MPAWPAATRSGRPTSRRRPASAAIRGLREDGRPHADRGARGARRRPVPREVARVALLSSRRWPGRGPRLRREGGRHARRSARGIQVRRGPGAAVRGRRVRRGRPRTRRGAVVGSLPDDGEPHGDAPAAQGAAGRARRPRAPGRLGRSSRQAPLRLHASAGAHAGGARSRSSGASTRRSSRTCRCGSSRHRSRRRGTSAR